MLLIYSVAVSLILGLLVGFLLKSQRGQIPFKLFAGSLVIGLGGLLLLWFSTAMIERSQVIEKWPTVEGMVLNSEIIGNRAPHPQVIYEYQVGNKKYSDTTEPHTPGFSFYRIRRKVAMVTLSDYPPGSPILVRYDPENPENNYISNQLNWSVYSQTGLAICLIAFMTSISFLYRKKRR